MDSFQESLAVNCFFTAKNGELHQTLARNRLDGNTLGLMNAGI
jgi:hypothetical protein